MNNHVEAIFYEKCSGTCTCILYCIYYLINSKSNVQKSINKIDVLLILERELQVSVDFLFPGRNDWVLIL